MSSGITPELRWHAIGRRKLGIARVYLTPGSGKWSINGRTLGDYFPRPSLVSHIQQPFTATDTLGAFDVKARVVGGGLTAPVRPARCVWGSPGRWCWRMTGIGRSSESRGSSRAIRALWSARSRAARARGSGSSSRRGNRLSVVGYQSPTTEN